MPICAIDFEEIGMAMNITVYFLALSVFETQVLAIRKERSRYLIYAEHIASHLYVLLNCGKVKPYTG